MKLRLRALRKQRGLTIDQTVGLTGLSRGFISQLENEVREPSAETLKQLAAAFGVKLSDMVDPGAEAAEFSDLMEASRELDLADLRALVLMAQSLRARARP